MQPLPVLDGEPEELGAVRWGRDLTAALDTSRQSGKPVFLLFTEIPGCSTVRGFGNGALRHPLLVEAIEDELVPVVVRNNVDGEEREILEAFDEPSWNNPVVRFLDADGSDLVPRYASGWTSEGLTRSMIAALEAANRPVPGYLRNLLDELAANRETSVFSMYCFWSGEVRLAGLDGVVSTRPGFANGAEVVEVVWDKRRTTADRLYEQAAARDAASGVVVFDEAQRAAASAHFDQVVDASEKLRYSAKDDKYQLKGSSWADIAMTAAQATSLNRAVTQPLAQEAIEELLSPRQLRAGRE